MSKFIADDLFDGSPSGPAPSRVVTPAPLPIIVSPAGDPAFALGDTHWFDGDVPFGTLVTQLQEQGVMSRSPHAIPLPYLSVSQVELYLKCPKQFEWRYIKGQKRAPGVAMVQGTTIHKAVEEGYRKKMRGENAELDFVLDTYSGELDKNLAGDVVWEANEDDDNVVGKDAGKVKDQGVSLLKRWHKDRLPIVQPKGVEKSFVTSFGGIPVVGRVDLIDRVDQPMDPAGDAAQSDMHPMLDVVVDNKVTGKVYAAALVNAKLQMTLYSHATGIPRQRYDLFVKTKIPKLVEMMTSRDARQIRWAAQTFVGVAQAIAAGSFPACSPENFLCCEKWCGFYNVCRGAA
jgi:hypothetical protein